MTGSICLTMIILFTIGLQIPWPQPNDAKRYTQPTSKEVEDKEKQKPVESHTPQKQEPFVHPSPPVKVPGLPAGLNLSDLRRGVWPLGPRKMLENKLSNEARMLRHHLKKNEVSVPPEIAELNPWGIWRGWVQKDSLYPEGAFYSDEMNHILATMATSNFTSFGVGSKGTQLKATVMLGRQRMVFKPKR